MPGGAIHYRSEGRGPPLVLLHGGGTNHAMWDPLIQMLAAQRRVIRWDARGHGRSTAPADPAASQAEDLKLLLDELGIGRATVAGYSMGGGAAAAFALRHPERVERLILIATAGPPPGVPRAVSAPPPPESEEGRRLHASTGVPLLLIVGDGDSERVRRAAEAMAAANPLARLVRVPNAGHDLVAEWPEAMVCLLLRPESDTCLEGT